jgi:thiamine-phosphate diphosphorylase
MPIPRAQVTADSIVTYSQLGNALRLYAVTDPQTPAGPRLIAQVEQAIAGGVTAVQLRDKRSPMSEVVDAGRAIRRLTSQAGVMFIVNDRIDLALALDADGVHLGQDDFPPAIARQLLGPDKVIGVSVGSRDEARPELLDVADYVGVGPMFATRTKQDAGRAVGPDRIRELKPLICRPIVGIGGVGIENAAQVISAGADGIAVVAAIFRAADIAVASRKLRIVVDNAFSQARPSSMEAVQIHG